MRYNHDKIRIDVKGCVWTTDKDQEEYALCQYNDNFCNAKCVKFGHAYKLDGEIIINICSGDSLACNELTDDRSIITN